MSSSSSIFRRFRQAVAPVIAFTIMVYFIFHSIEGNRGVLAYWSMQDRVSEISHALDDVVLLRQDRERRVRALRSSSLDPDLLDERARIMLNTAHRDDLIIFHHDGYDLP